MRVMNAVGSMLGILALLTLGAGTAGNDAPEGLNLASAMCLSPATDLGDYHVERPLWQRPGSVAPGQVPRDAKIWI